MSKMILLLSFLLIGAGESMAQEVQDTILSPELVSCRYDLYWSRRHQAVLEQQYRIVRLQRDSLLAELNKRPRITDTVYIDQKKKAIKRP